MRSKLGSKVIPYIFVLLGVLVIFRFFFEVYRQAVNVPHRDDFDTYLNFLVRWEQAQTLRQKAALLFEPHNEHVIAFLKSVAVVAWHCFGAIDFRVLALVGDLALVLLLFGLLFAFSLNMTWQRGAIAGFPVVALLFQPRIYEATMWATTSMSLLWVMAFALCGFALLEHERIGARIGGQILLLLACISNGNGVIALGLGMLMLFSRRRYLEGSFSLLLGVGWLVLVRGLGSPSASNVAADSILERSGKIIDYGLVFIGSGVAQGDLGLAWYLGLAQLLAVAVLFAAGLPRKRLALAASIIFVLLSVAANSYLRSGLGIGSALSSRYQFLSVLLLGSIYLAVLEISSGRKRVVKLVVWLCALLGLAFNISSYWLTRFEVEGFREFIIYPTLEWMGGDGRRGLSYFDTQQAALALERAEQLGIYRLPVEELAREFSQEVSELPQLDRRAKVEYSVDSLVETRYMLSIFGWACVIRPAVADPQVAVLLESRESKRIYSTKVIMRPDVSKHFSILTGKPINLDSAGFIARIPKGELAPGEYRIGIVVKGRKRAYLRWLDQPFAVN